ncbi:MAG: PspC domain-containing protein [Spirochaetota bacterium]
MRRRLYLGRDKRIAGVCSGIADYFAIDATLVRVGWILFMLAGGSGILAYIIAMVVMPEKPDNIDDL